MRAICCDCSSNSAAETGGVSGISSRVSSVGARSGACSVVTTSTSSIEGAGAAASVSSSASPSSRLGVRPLTALAGRARSAVSPPPTCVAWARNSASSGSASERQFTSTTLLLKSMRET